MTIYLIRHATAGTRGGNGAANDLDRELDALGVDQATGIAERLGVEPISRVLSSRALRCVQTVAPLAEKLGLSVEHSPELLEGQSAVMAVELCRRFAADGVTAGLCSHGDIIPDTIQTLAREGLVIIGPRGWAKGSTWRLNSRGGDLVSAEFLGPY
ncbi:MAG: SixA phosphatase family protein [Acidimicrobiales bacterium]